MNRQKNLAIAFLAAAVVPAFGFAFTSGDLVGGLDNNFGKFFGMTFVFYVYSLIATGILAVPMHWVLRRVFNVGLAWSPVGGAMVGALIALVLGFRAGLDEVSQALPLTSGLGAAAGFVFWAVLAALGRNINH